MSGSSDGRTISSIEKVVGVQAGAAGTSAYWLVPLKVDSGVRVPGEQAADTTLGTADERAVCNPALVDERPARVRRSASTTAVGRQLTALA